MTQQWTITADGWYDTDHHRQRYPYGTAGTLGFISLEKPPFSQMIKVDYVDGDGMSVEWTDYHLITMGDRRTRLEPKANEVWPSLQVGQSGSVVIVYETGVADQSLVPPRVAGSIRDISEHRYEHGCLPSEEWYHALDQQMAGYSARAYA